MRGRECSIDNGLCADGAHGKLVDQKDDRATLPRGGYHCYCYRLTHIERIGRAVTIRPESSIDVYSHRHSG